MHLFALLVIKFQYKNVKKQTFFKINSTKIFINIKVNKLLQKTLKIFCLRNRGVSFKIYTSVELTDNYNL